MTETLSWDSFIGQDALKNQLIISCRAAKMRNEPLEHMLFAAGEGGVGKSTLARLVAQEMGTKLHEVSGKLDVKAARMILSGMEPNDILFIDEIHQCFPKTGEWLLPLLQDGVLLGKRGPEQQPPITVLAATTESGKIPQTVLSRFSQPAFAPYRDCEATQIAEVFAERLFEKTRMPSAWNYLSVATAANNNPRMIGRVLRSLRDLASCDPRLWEDGEYDITQALKFQGLTEDGLTALACRYITLMFKEYDGGCGGQAICNRLQEPGGIISTERLLMQKGLLQMTSSGRELTQAGFRRVKELLGVEK